MKNIAIIAAAGSGTRFGDTLPKQYHTINGVMILDAALENFINNPAIAAVQVAISPEHLTYYQQSKFIHHPKLMNVVFGGARRQDSVFSALMALEGSLPSNVLIHDAARPFVTSELIDNVLIQLQTFDAVDIALSAPDTIKTRDTFNIIDRDSVYLTQTPQGFRYNAILQAYQQYSTLETTYTDDIAIGLKAGLNTTSIPGNRTNFKITTSEDMEIAQQLLNSHSPIYRTGFGFDVHQLQAHPNSTIMLSGIGIPSEYKVIAHSDGDVVIHALMDAILGAIGEDDIGYHFPPSDDKWKGIQSSKMLEIVIDLLKKKGGNIVNVDITVAAEKPRLTLYKPQMKEWLSSALAIPMDCISVKATTTEKMGFIGRNEGIAAFANCLIKLGT